MKTLNTQSKSKTVLRECFSPKKLSFLKMGDVVFLDQYLKMVSYVFITACIMEASPYSIYYFANILTSLLIGFSDTATLLKKC